MYRYVKSAPKKFRSTHPIIISWVFMIFGAVIVAWTIWPIASFFVIQRNFFTKTVSPLSEETSNRKNQQGVLMPVIAAEPGSLLTGDTTNYANPNVWFPASPQKKVVTLVNSYQISIPKLKIRNATVIIAGDDLKKSLIHYGGTGIPGDYGNTVIFGHSTLPQFYNPTNYSSIFSMLPTLKEGDDILVLYDGITYRYVVYELVVLNPNDLSPLEQRFDDSYLTLVTCVPPGTYWERLNVKARLMRI